MTAKQPLGVGNTKKLLARRRVRYSVAVSLGCVPSLVDIRAVPSDRSRGDPQGRRDLHA